MEVYTVVVQVGFVIVIEMGEDESERVISLHCSFPLFVSIVLFCFFLLILLLTYAMMMRALVHHFVTVLHVILHIFLDLDLVISSPPL